MTAMVGQDVVGLAEVGAHPGADRLLTDILVDRAVDETLIERDLGLLLEGTDQAHGLVELEDMRGLVLARCCLGHVRFPTFCSVPTRYLNPTSC